VVVIGGPNGAGKTTCASLLLPEALGIREFVHADVIAAGLSAFSPETVALQAGRIMLQLAASWIVCGNTGRKLKHVAISGRERVLWVLDRETYELVREYPDGSIHPLEPAASDAAPQPTPTG